MIKKLIKANKLHKILFSILEQNNVREDVAIHMIEGVIQASLRGVDSHGIRLFPHYLEGFRKGRLNKNPDYKFYKTGLATSLLNADNAPGHSAGMVGMKKAIALAKKAGIGAVAVSNSSHFGAAAYFSFAAAKEDMIGLSFTHATAHVPPKNGVRPFLGNNPFCLVAPSANELPYCFDMATTRTTFNNVQNYLDKNKKIPKGLALDKNGNPTEDPAKVFNLLSIGDYKGFGLSMSLEILCSLLTGMEYGPNVSAMFDGDLSKKRKIGHYFIAINIASFVDVKIFKSRIQDMMDDLRTEPNNGLGSILVPGDPEKITFKKRRDFGLKIDKKLYDLIKKYFPDK